MWVHRREESFDVVALDNRRIGTLGTDRRPLHGRGMASGDREQAIRACYEVDLIAEHVLAPSAPKASVAFLAR